MDQVLFHIPEPMLETVDHEPLATPQVLRYAMPDETPLSTAEIVHGMRHGLIWHCAAHPAPAPARAHAFAGAV